jgi:hypothetical protein
MEHLLYLLAVMNWMCYDAQYNVVKSWYPTNNVVRSAPTLHAGALVARRAAHGRERARGLAAGGGR